METILLIMFLFMTIGIYTLCNSELRHNFFRESKTAFSEMMKEPQSKPVEKNKK